MPNGEGSTPTENEMSGQRRFSDRSDQDLFNIIVRMSGGSAPQVAASVELLERYLKRVEVQVAKLTNSSERLETLTKWLTGLTITLAFLALLQLAAMIWDLINRHGATG